MNLQERSVRRCIIGCLALVVLGGCDSILGPPRGSGLWVREANVVLDVGEQGRLTAHYEPGPGALYDTAADASWRSDAPGVLSIAGDGTVTAHSAGIAHVFVSKDGHRDSLTVRVVSERSYATRWAGVSVGNETTCGWTTAGRIYCWGGDYYGAIGDGVRRQWTNAHAPSRIASNATFRMAAVGLFFACGLTEARETFCWGDPLAMGTETPTLSPRQVAGASSLVWIGAGQDHACGIDGQGEARCWGASGSGELGDGQASAIRPEARPVAGDTRFTRLVVGAGHNCALAMDDRVFCWGSAFGLGDPGGSDRLVPTPLSEGGRYSDLEGEGNTCARSAESGDWLCWGANRLRQLEGTEEWIPPTVLGPDKQLEHVMPGWSVTCGHDGDGRLLCWGHDEHGNLGDDSSTPDSCCSSQPRPVAGDLVFRTVSSSQTATCGVTTDDALYCWGWNRTGQLGDGSLVSHSDVPVRVVDPF